ncbi:ABC transporter ATP-binding protein [Oceanospirillaceae bacterium]|nr:ABC transporter ATP-binding protein [Oceanospirillaceae bacterium]
MNALEIIDLNRSFGAISVIEGLTLSIKEGQRHAIIGPNGAGKTTLFNMLTGWLPPSSGSIMFGDKSIAGMIPSRITASGMARSFQINALFDGLTVRQNLRLSAQALHPSRLDVIASFNAYSDIEELVIFNAERMALTDYMDKPVQELSYGIRRQLEVALALTSEPKLLLLDEPAAGTSPSERLRLVNLITRLPKSTTILLVEHDMDLVFEISDRITVLTYGSVLADGSPDEIRRHKAVSDAYLGKNHA